MCNVSVHPSVLCELVILFPLRILISCCSLTSHPLLYQHLLVAFRLSQGGEVINQPSLLHYPFVALSFEIHSMSLLYQSPIIC